MPFVLCSGSGCNLGSILQQGTYAHGNPHLSRRRIDRYCLECRQRRRIADTVYRSRISYELKASMQTSTDSRNGCCRRSKSCFLPALHTRRLPVSPPLMRPTISNAVVPGELFTEPPTLINLGFEWLIQGDDNRNASVCRLVSREGQH